MENKDSFQEIDNTKETVKMKNIKQVSEDSAIVSNNKQEEPDIYGINGVVKDERPEDTEVEIGRKSMTDDFMRTCLHMQLHGAHYDTETRQFRIYNSDTGLWHKITRDTFRFLFSKVYNSNRKLPRGKSHIIEEKLMDDIWYQLLIDNPIGESWNPDKSGKQFLRLPFSNGVLDLKTRVKEKFYKEQYLESKLERKYEPEAGTDCPNWQILMKHLSQEDQTVQDVLEAFALLAMTGKGRLEHSVLSLYDQEGGSGKGTYINVLEQLAGPDRAKSSDIARLNDDTTVGEFEAKTLITFPEEREVFRSGSSLYAQFLKLAALDTISGRPVFSRETFQFKPTAVMIFASNYHVFPSDGAGARRVLMLKTYPYPKEKRDRTFGQKLKEELPKITNYLLDKFDWDPEKAMDTIERGSQYEVFLQCAKESAEETNSVASFLSEMTIPLCSIHNDRELSTSEYKQNPKAYIDMPIAAISLSSLYSAYKMYLVENNPGAKPMKKTNFKKEITKYYRVNCGLELHTTNSNIPNLMGSPERIIGIYPNPQTWINEYKILKQ